MLAVTVEGATPLDGMAKTTSLVSRKNEPRVAEAFGVVEHRAGQRAAQRAVCTADGLAAYMRGWLQRLDGKPFGVSMQNAQELVLGEFGSGDVAISGR